ncbi:MAG TPA: RidA family protein [Candidatus Binatia bacterium]|nr:RidA family protein [Candidatus Binatia bacterium]
MTAAPQAAWKPEALVEDERGRGVPAVVRFGPYLFVAGSDGYRSLQDERIDPKLAENAIEQCRNSYGRVARRLERAGYGGDCAIWIENFTSGQHWRLERMALWPEYFGEENHERAVSFGAQTRMDGINMLTSIVMAIDPALERRVAVPAPHRGRASRCTRVGPFTFVIGVRGGEDPVTKEAAPEETPGSFDLQLDNAFKWLASHLGRDENVPENFLRVDATMRAARFIPRFEAAVRQRFGGKIPFASYAIGTPLGGHHEQELGGVAIIPGEKKSVFWSNDGSVADATTGGGLVFLRSVSGVVDEKSGKILKDSYGDTRAQTAQAVRNVETLLSKAGSSLERVVRLDVFLKDIYAQDEVVDALRGKFGSCGPAISFLGCEPRNLAEVEMIAIAGAA